VVIVAVLGITQAKLRWTSKVDEAKVGSGLRRRIPARHGRIANSRHRDLAGQCMASPWNTCDETFSMGCPSWPLPCAATTASCPGTRLSRIRASATNSELERLRCRTRIFIGHPISMPINPAPRRPPLYTRRTGGAKRCAIIHPTGINDPNYSGRTANTKARPRSEEHDLASLCVLDQSRSVAINPARRSVCGSCYTRGGANA
jgi:hypothetical protein